MNVIKIEDASAKDLAELLPFIHSAESGISWHEGKLIFIQGYRDDGLDGKIEPYLNQLYDFILGHIEPEDLPKDVIDILVQLGVNVSEGVVFNQEYDEVVKYILDNSDLKPNFHAPQYMTLGYFDPVGFIGYYWPLEDVIDSLTEDDIKKCWGVVDEESFELTNNDFNKNLLEKALKIIKVV